MLTAFRRDLAGVVTAEEEARGCGSADVGAGEGGGGRLAEGALRPLLGVFKTDLLDSLL